jgi:hypothetical protein
MVASWRGVRVLAAATMKEEGCQQLHVISLAAAKGLLLH